MQSLLNQQFQKQLCKELNKYFIYIYLKRELPW